MKKVWVQSEENNITDREFYDLIREGNIKAIKIALASPEKLNLNEFIMMTLLNAF